MQDNAIVINCTKDHELLCCNILYYLVASPGERSERMEKRICFAESSWDSDGTISDGGGIGGRFIKGVDNRNCNYMISC